MASLMATFVLLVALSDCLHLRVTGEPQVPCLFIFGDSLSDAGNNNYLPTLAKAIYPPYGIDFPKGPTGRFTNGRTIVDVLAELLGFDTFISPFTSASRNDVLKGLNYASGSSGIRDESGTNAGFHISMNMQLEIHKFTTEKLSKMLGGKDQAQKHLNKCIYSVGLGSNDYLNNYLVDLFPTNKKYTPEQFAEALADEYSKQLQTLYDLGARKFVLLGLASIGCIPSSITHYKNKLKNGECVEEINDKVYLFNDKLVQLVNDFNKKLTDSKFIYVNISGMSSTNDLKLYGFSNIYEGCCKVGLSGLCLPGQKPCEERTKYFYWDSFHPTEAVNEIAAKNAYKALAPHHVYPYDISQLAQQ